MKIVDPNFYYTNFSSYKCRVVFRQGGFSVEAVVVLERRSSSSPRSDIPE